jgi:hypothetical protein
MEAIRFDALVSELSRRRTLRLLGSLGIVPLLGHAHADARRKKRNKKKQRKQRPLQPPTLNAFGCVDVGQACRGNSSLCCSGICQGAAPAPGKPDTSLCVPHNVGICQAGQDDCLGVQVACGPQAFCTRTTGNASFCAGIGQCRVCARDTDCEAEFGPGAACIVCASSCPDTITGCNAAGA